MKRIITILTISVISKENHPLSTDKTAAERMHPEAFSPAYIVLSFSGSGYTNREMTGQPPKKRLALAAIVDFSAGSGKHKELINPVYEAKSAQWKAIYPARREIDAMAAAFVKQWLQAGIRSNAGRL